MGLLLLVSCGLWITSAEQSAKLDGLADGDTESGDDGGGDNGGDNGGGDEDRVEIEVIDSFEFVGTSTHATFHHEPDAGALSRLVYCGPFGGENDGYVAQVDDWEAQTYEEINVYNQGDVEANPTRGGWFEDGVPFLVPVSPDFPANDHEWSYDFVINAAGVPFDCVAVTRYDRERASGRLDVRVVFASDEVEAADAARAPYPGAIQWLEEAFAAAGIALTVTAYEDAPSGCERTVVRDATGAAALAACVTEPGAREAVVVLVDEVGDSWAEGGDAYGRTITPGVPMLGGGAASIAVVDLAAAAAGERVLTRAMAHQLGHLLGLYDLHDVDGPWEDPIADNAECSWDGTLDVGDCTANAKDDIMWPYADESQAVVISDDQGWVLRANPVVRP